MRSQHSPDDFNRPTMRPSAAGDSVGSYGGGEKHTRPPDPFTRDQIAECVRMVEVALTYKSRDRAVAAIDRLFADDRGVVHAVDYNSPLEALGLRQWTVTTLHGRGVCKVGALLALSQSGLLAMPRIGPDIVREVRTALGRFGLKLVGDHTPDLINPNEHALDEDCED